MVKIRMKRMGAAKRPYYRIVVADSRSPRDGKFIDHIGYYHPIAEAGKQLKFDGEKLTKWFMNGAQPTDIVRKLLNKQSVKFDRKLLSK